MPDPTVCVTRRLSMQYDGGNAADVVAMLNLPTAQWDSEAAQLTWSIESESATHLVLVGKDSSGTPIRASLPAGHGDHLVWSYEVCGSGLLAQHTDQEYHRLYADLP
jgi:hypothetical protein